MIIDEGDYWFVKHTAKFKDNDLIGAYQLKHAHKVIVLTATATRFLKQMIQTLQPEANITDFMQSFKTKSQYSNPLLPPYQISNVVSADYETSKQKFIKKVLDVCQRKPVFCFIEDGEINMLEELRKLVPPAIKVHGVKEKEDALALRTSEQNEKRGVFVLSRLYCRGLDIKLLQDAITVVLASSKGFSWSTLTQMAGRSCRSLGVSECIYFNHTTNPNVDLSEQLANKEMDLQDAHLIFKTLYDNWETRSSKQKASIKAYCSQCKYVTKYQKFESEDRAILLAMTEKDKPRESGEPKKSIRDLILQQ